MNNFKVVLASESPRRKQIMEQIGAEFEIWPSQKEETVNSTEPEAVCTSLAEQKALDVAVQIQAFYENHPDLATPQDILIIGADTIVAVPKDKTDGEDACEILGKPKNEEDAVRMLSMLSGNVHRVLTGICFVFMQKKGKVRKTSFYEETNVHVCKLDKEEIAAYVASGEPLDKAGAYGIQGAFAKYISKIDGDYYNVMGLPVSRIYGELKNFGIKLS